MSKLTKRLAMARPALLGLVLLAACGEETTTVVEDVIQEVRVLPESASLSVGRTIRLSAEVRDSRGRSVPEPISWTSSDSTVATVDSTGLVLAVSSGQVQLVGKSRGKSGRSTITVTPVAVASVDITPGTANLVVGAQIQLTATPLSAADSALAGRSVTWTSSNPAVASVNQSGVVSALAAGRVTVSATSESVTGFAIIDASLPSVGAVTTLAATASDAASVTLRFTEVSDGTGAPASYMVRLAAGTLSWGSATPVGSGTCTGPIAGTSVGAVRTCTVTGLSASTAYQFQMVAFRGTLGSAVYGPLSNIASRSTTTAPAAAVASIALSPTTASASVGGTVSFTPTLRDAAGNTLTGRSVTWSSTNPAVGTVSASGVASAIAAGTTTIRATSEGITGQATFTVTAPAPSAVASVVVGPASRSATVGDLVQFSVTLRDASGNVLTGRTVTWSSTSPSIAAVSGTGLASALAAGSSTIRATSEGVTGQAVITVTAGSSTSTVFTSEWSTATGNSANAVTDGGTWPELRCGTTFPNVLNVVSGSSVGFSRSANVLRVQQRGASDCGMLQRNNVVPQSTTHWGRFYFRNDDVGSSQNHPTAYHQWDGQTQMVPWLRDASMPNNQNRIGIQVGQHGYPYQRWYSPPLQNGVWYRYEWMTEYTSATTYRIFPRIYDAAGTLLYDIDDFMQTDYSRSSDYTLAEFYALDGGSRVFTLGIDAGDTNAGLARNFGMGNEGNASAPATMGYWYYARIGFSITGWLGQ